LQALVQRYVDQSISSTVNLPADTRLSAIEGLYRKAWESGCKGITVFREGSRASVLERDESEGPHPDGNRIPRGRLYLLRGSHDG
jgi:ribonucleotide reductase alpha subunit